MGAVFLAQQTHPLKRQVALKLIKTGMDTREVISRFQAERQALAMMDHPNIASVLDAGTTPEGRPYFVMELVRGIPITDYCDENRLSIDDRLRLFIDVCRAIQHAHQKGIIHRDIKPSNVMITLHEGVPVVKVIDFGVAKALNQELSERTLFTQFSQMIGTPLYMSPEQAEMSGLDIDTRSDVYSLGVLLYELLTGTTPFGKETLQKSGLEEMRRLIREVDPPRPSARISTLRAEALSTVSQKRRIDPRRLSLFLGGELDWIVMKSLEKERSRRYESASALAADTQRYLADEPVEACPASLGYQLRKSGRRHKRLLATLLLVLIISTAGAVVSLAYAGKARSAQRDAEQMAVEAARANDHSKTLLYAADMKLASDAIANEDLLRARELLARHVPTAEEKDLRGFEWQLFQKRLAQDADVTLNQGVRIQDAEFSPDGKWLATTAVSGGVDVYATDSWKQFRSFHTTAELVNGFAWSPNSGLLAAACADGNLFIWDLMTGSQRLRISAHEGEANDVVFSPDARHLYSGGDDHLAVKWGVETGEQQLVFSGHSRAVERISLAPDGKTLATSGENYSLWDTGSGQRLRSFSHDIARVLCVAFSPDGRFVAAGDLEGHVYLTDCETGESQTLAHQADAIEALTFFADGQWLATADRGGAIQLHRLPKSLDEMLSASAAQSPRWIAHEDRALAITASPDGRRIVSGGRDSLLRSWTPDLHACRWSVGQDHYHSIAVGPNNRLYAAGHKIHVFDLTDRRLIDAFAPADPLWERVECTADGRFLAAVRAGELALFELASSQMVRKWSLDKQHIQPHRMAISSDGKVIALAVYPPKVLLYQTESQSPPVRLPMRLCDALAFAPEKQLLAAGYGDVDDLHLFDLKSGGAARVLEGHTSTLSGVAFSPDGSLLATVSHDRLLKVWRLDTGEEIFSIVAHRASILSVSFAPDGKTIVTGAKDGLVKFWHTATGQPLGTLPSGRVGVDKLCFNGGDQLCALINGKVVIHDASAIPRTPAEVVASGISMDNTVEFRGLGDLPGGETWSVAMGVSSDGRFVVGRSYTESDYDPFLWTSQSGMRSPNRFHREALGGQSSCVSDDGRILCGAGASKGESKAARLWIGEQPSINIAPHWSIAEGMSADGSVVVGYQFFKGTCSAFRWCSGETQLLQASSQHRYSIARAVTRDGNTALGMVFNTAGSWRKNREDHALVRNACPVIWDAQGLRFLSGFDPGFNWWPYDLSDDGSVVVGLCWEQSAESPNSVEHRKEWAFVWRSGQVTLLEPLPGYSGGNARRVSGDGRVIIGYSDGYKRPWAAPGPGNQAWIWDAVHGVRNLRELLARHGLALDWHLFDAIDLSEDCRTIVGSGVNPAREREAWRARLPAETFE